MEHPKDFAKGLSIGIIMDGNGRWAKSRGLPRTAGHKKGAQVFQDIANYCDELGVESVYFYAFSTENWKRPAEEVGAIMRLFGEYLIKGFDYKNRNIRIRDIYRTRIVIFSVFLRFSDINYTHPLLKTNILDISWINGIKCHISPFITRNRLQCDL